MMEKNIIYIDNNPFAVDQQGQRLISVDDPSNTIPREQMKDEGEFYLIRFDSANRKFTTELWDLSKPNENILEVVVPNLVFDPGFWKNDASIARINKLSFSRGWNIMVTDRAMRERLSGKLPHIDIAGQDYIVDWRLKELRSSDNPSHRLNLKEMAMDESGENYLCLYDTTTKMEFHPHAGTKIPAGIIMLKIPFELRLDPVGVAREYGMSDVAMLSQYPIRQKLEAQVLPVPTKLAPTLAKTPVPEKAAQKVNRNKGKRL